MRFHVGSLTLQLEIIPAPLIDHRGDIVLSMLDLDAEVIRLSSDCPPRARPAAVAACVHDAWLLQTARPQSIEESGRLFGMMAEQWTRDLESHGGLLSLMMLDAPTDDAPAEFTSTLTGSAAEVLRQCSTCSQRIASGSVATSSVRKHARLGAPVVDLAFYCDNCEHAEVVTELANGAGRPSGQRTDEPRRLTGDELEAFVRAHPEKTGVCLVG